MFRLGALRLFGCLDDFDLLSWVGCFRCSGALVTIECGR